MIDKSLFLVFRNSLKRLTIVRNDSGVVLDEIAATTHGRCRGDCLDHWQVRTYLQCHQDK